MELIKKRREQEYKWLEGGFISLTSDFGGALSISGFQPVCKLEVGCKSPSPQICRANTSLKERCKSPSLQICRANTSLKERYKRC